MNYSKKICIGCVVFFLFAACFYAQTSVRVSENTEVTQPKKSDSVVDESTLPIRTPSNQVSDTSRGATVWLFIRMILVLAVVIVCIYGVLWLMKRNTGKINNTDQFLRVVSSVTLSPGKSVQIVSLLDQKAYIIGVTDNAVNLIGEVTDKETIDAMNLYADKQTNTKKPRNFNDILSIFMPNGPKEKNGNIFSGTGDKAAGLLKQQRDRLNPGK
ncbi:MAG: flagellar biosynthetic protein FliO [Treponema sp.]